MEESNSSTIIPEEVVLSKIYIIRNVKVMLDRDLAALYGVETKYLKRQVKRNMIRFPEDFMFELTKDELQDWRSQFVTSNEDKIGLRYAPFAFTEEGVAQLSTVLGSEQAIKVNIQIIRLFVKLRKIIHSHLDILHKLDKLDRNDIDQDRKIKLIFSYLRQLEQDKKQDSAQRNRQRIGFKK